MTVTINLTDEQIALLKVGEVHPLYGDKRIKITGPETIADCVSHMRNLSQEHFTLLTLDVRNQVINQHTITKGLLDASLVHPREAFRVAFMDNAARIIVSHNHPSGDCNPSDDDIAVTKRLATAGKVLGVPVIDHIIVGRGDKNNYYSFQEHNQI